MNYTIIGYTEDYSHQDRCGDWISRPGNFETQFFRDEDKTKFLKAWAHAKFHNTYENLIILLNGIPDGQLNDAEYEAYEDLDRELDPFYAAISAEHDLAEKLRKDAAAEAALVQARQIAARQRAADEAQLKALQKKLGLSS
jgi:hypothetical protein